MTPERQEELWKKLETELWKHGLEITFRGYDFDTRTFKPIIKRTGEKPEARPQFSYLCLDDWRQNEIDAAIATVKKALKP